MHEGAPALPDKDERAQPEPPENRPPDPHPPESEADARARRAASGYDLRPGRPAYPAAAPRQPQTPAAPKLPDQWCANCRIWNRPDAESCVSCGGPLEESEQRQRTNAASHTLVWICAFMPLAALVVEIVLVSLYIGVTWWTFAPMFIINAVILGFDRATLRRQGYHIDRLSGWMVLLIPVYLFRRRSVAGGGRRYAIVWVVTFLAWMVISSLMAADTTDPPASTPLAPPPATATASAPMPTDASPITDVSDIYLNSGGFIYSNGLELILQFVDAEGNSFEFYGTATVDITDESTGDEESFTRRISESSYERHTDTFTEQDIIYVQLDIPHRTDAEHIAAGQYPVVQIRFDGEEGYWDYQLVGLVPGL